MPNGQEGITAFSGVFQHAINLPFLNCVNIDSAGYEVNNAFAQYYNHYDCPNFPIYSASSNEMNTVFFGGMAQYYVSDGILTQNNDVPFVKTIARVSRNASGKMAEYKLPIEMPSLLGAGSEIIPNENLPRYANGVIKFDELPNDTTLIGYIYGGISSTAENIFWINNGTQSTATSQIFAVKLVKNGAPVTHQLNEQSFGSLQVRTFPDTEEGSLLVKYNISKTTAVRISIRSINGQKIADEVFKNQSPGEHRYSKEIKSMIKGGTYILTVETDYEKATLKIVVEI
jgi:hypothetical protein